MGGGPNRGFLPPHISGRCKGMALPGLFVLGLGLESAGPDRSIESAVVVHVLFNLLNIVLTWISTSASV